MNYFKPLIIYFALLCSTKAHSQNHDLISKTNRIIQEDIEKAKQAIITILSKDDSINTSKGNKPLNIETKKAIMINVGAFKSRIESDSLLNNDRKNIYLEGFENILNNFRLAYQDNKISLTQLFPIIAAYQSAMDLDRNGASILSVIKENDLETGKIISKCISFKNNTGIIECNEFILLQEIKKNEKKILPLLFYNSSVRFADSLIKIAARTQPEQLYIFAQAKNSLLGKRIVSVNDPLVRLISTIAGSKDGRLYFPFLGSLNTGKLTMTEISKTFDNKTAYYKLLVKTQIDHAKRLKAGDTITASNSLIEMLKMQAFNEYINVVNELHEQPDRVRLKVLNALNSEDLYYLCITGENELYTSSYLKIYKLIFNDVKLKNGYELLQKINFDHFKRFIKMASNFNTLDDFLHRMDKGNADNLMRSFVKGMEGPNGLEDAVDVADSYASLPGIRLRSLILEEVQKNLSLLSQSKNKIGSSIYGVLNTIFLSMDTAHKIDVSASLGIPPVYQLNNNSLQDSTGKIIIQQFFYGDKDGQYQFDIFVKSFPKSNWKITWKKDWVELNTVKGKKVVIYTNRPLDEEFFLDIKAQEALGKYLKQNNLQPTIVIHRGHSYYLQSTIRQLAPSAKLVLLGSCGGYNNLSQVIKTCPYVHIIATKQLGSGNINQPMIVYLTELLRQGKNFNWPAIWKSLAERFKGNERFDDYIPPHQNLGAIFIMAYNKAMGL